MTHDREKDRAARRPGDPPRYPGVSVRTWSPPVFLGLDRFGLPGGAPAALLCILVGSSAGVAVAVTLRQQPSRHVRSPFPRVGPPGRHEVEVTHSKPDGTW
ncbi:MAG: hypothetical protein DLM61_27285 [Pseudonocardiales bacterium]|nr:MAG: hypothetical protein DLM61_27285 [Pseudonocardiales bacterium]